MRARNWTIEKIISKLNLNCSSDNVAVMASCFSFSPSSQWWPAASFHSWRRQQGDAGGHRRPRRWAPLLPLPQPPHPPPYGPEPRCWTDQRRRSQSVPGLPVPLSQQHQPHTLLPVPLLQPRLLLLLQRNGTQPVLPGRAQDRVTTPGVNQKGGERRKLAFHTKAISFSLAHSSSVVFVLALLQWLSPFFSPSLSMPKIHRMKEERRRERRREKGGKRKIETKNLYLSKQMKQRHRGTFLSAISTRHVSTLPLWRKKQTNQGLFNKELEETADLHVEVHKPKMTNDNFTRRHGNGVMDKTKKGKEEEKDYAYVLFLFFLNNDILQSCGFERRRAGRIRLNQKFTCGGGGGWIHNVKKKRKRPKKKTTSIPKSQIPKTKNTERKALFKGRVNTEAIQDQDSTATHTHLHTNIKNQSILSSTHPVCVSSCVSDTLYDHFLTMLFHFCHECLLELLSLYLPLVMRPWNSTHFSSLVRKSCYFLTKV